MGNLAIGALAGGRVGVNRTLMGCGVCCALCAGAYLSQLPRLRQSALSVLERKERSVEAASASEDTGTLG